MSFNMPDLIHQRGRHGEFRTCTWCGVQFRALHRSSTQENWFCARPCFFAYRTGKPSPLRGTGDMSRRWKDWRGYVLAPKPPTHMSRTPGRSIGEHLLIAERVFGRPLPAGAIVHHHNRNRADNRNGNLVICDSHAYHMLLHQRMRVLSAGFDPNVFKWCQSCGTHKPQNQFCVSRRRTDGLDGRCKSCCAARYQDRRRRGLV